MADYREATAKRNQLVHWIWDKPRHPRNVKHPLRAPMPKDKRPSIAFTLKEIEKLGDDLLWIEARGHLIFPQL